MDHVSTFCALSTVGIAPSGLALGRVERSKPSIFRRKTLLHESLSTPTESTSADVRPKTSWSARPSHAGARRPPSENGTDTSELHTSQCQGSDLRRSSLSFGAGRFRRRGQTLTNPPLRIPEDEPTQTPTESHSRRPSTSWLRRLSMVSFQTESQSTNSPVASSFNGSTGAILPRPVSQRRATNKLVKRSSSQHSNVHPGSVNPSAPTSSASPSSALRRPATSYQRSGTMRLQSPLAMDCGSRFSEAGESPAVEEFEVNIQDSWRPYLFPKSEGLSEKLSRRLSTAGSPKVPGMRRSVYDQDTLPALVLATTITSKSSILLEEGPVSNFPVQFRDPFQKSTEPPPVPPPQKPTHKHSYSLNDVEPKRVIVNTVTASGAPIPGQPGGGSLKRVKGRTFSIPRSEFSTSEHPIPRSPAFSQQRNITDPSVFRRPHTIAMADPDLPAATLRSVSHDYNIGIRGQRKLTSDAVALSAWQHACRSENYTSSSSLRRRPKRHSIAASDPASTIIGSDDTRVFTSCDEGETDMTDYWDSVRTRETNGSGLKGLRIETMFDKVGARLSNEEVTTLEELLPRGSFASRLEKEPSLFPARPSASPAARAQVNDSVSIMSAEDEDACSMVGALPGESEGPARQTLLSTAFSRPLERQTPHPTSAETQAGSSIEEARTCQKMNIFDWSEQTRPDRDLSDTEARPRTVHGKQNGVDRGSRAACHKVPSAIHLRSQSVPIARDLPTNDPRQTSGKFGTWGLGSKGVSEDWDSDFDFDDAEEAPGSQPPRLQECKTVPQCMTVPTAILERQASLRGQFGQVQELTLLVQELKRLRHQASVLDLVEGPSSELWKEAEGIVNLATIDDEEERRSPPGSPSSLTFSLDDSDEEEPNASSKRNSEGSWQGASQQPSQLSSPPFEHSEGSSEITWRDDPRQESLSCNPPLRRSPKNSSPSKSVRDVLQPAGRPGNSTLVGLGPTPRAQKMPFDTQSLRNLVVRAGVVTRALKEVIRKAEGVDPDPQDVFPSDPPFRRIFDQPSNDDLASFEAALAEMH